MLAHPQFSLPFKPLGYSTLQCRFWWQWNEHAVCIEPLFHGLSWQLYTSIPQSEETQAELSQITWVPRQVRDYFIGHWSALNWSFNPDHFAASEQTCNGDCPRYFMWNSQVHFTWHIPGLESGSEHSFMGTWVGWSNPYTGHHQTQAALDWRADP